MKDIDFNRELGRAALGAIVAFLVGLALKALGGGRWLVAGASGAAGGMVAVALLP